jgi:KaiC/GvpD/RAD55 family RecA-like ATPase
MEGDFFSRRFVSRDFETDETQWAFDGLIAKQAVTTIYAKSGTGKSYLALALAKRIAPFMRLVGYIDYEIRVLELEKRGVRQIVEQYPQFAYMHRSRIEVKRHEIVSELAKLAKGGYYKDALLILDGAKHFVSNIDDDKPVREMMSRLTDVRDDGATVLIIHHTNKSGKNYQGSKEIIDGSDNAFYASSAPVPEGYIGLSLGVEKMRDPIKEQSWRIKSATLEMQTLPSEIALMSEGAKESAQAILKALPLAGISQRALCVAIGKAENDKTTLALLKQYDGALWIKKEGKRGQSTFYYSLGEKREEITTVSDGSRNDAIRCQKSVVKSVVTPSNSPDEINPELPANCAVTRFAAKSTVVKSVTDEKTINKEEQNDG